MASSSASRSEASLSLLDTHNQQTIDNLSSFLHQPLHDLIATIALNQDSLILERAIHVLLTRQNLSEKDTLTEAEFAPYLKASNAFFSTPTEPVVSVHNRLLLQGLYEYLVTKNFADAKAYFISRTKSEIAPNTIKGLAYFLLGIMNQPKKIARSYFQKAIQHGFI